MIGQMVKSVFEKFSKCQGRKNPITTIYKILCTHFIFLKMQLLPYNVEKGKLSHLL